jgi:copper chaperone CopZ
MAVRRVEIDIQGMHCDACVASVREKVLACGGVASAEVKVGKAVVAFDDAVCKTKNVLEAIRSAGDFDVTGFQSAVE